MLPPFCLLELLSPLGMVLGNSVVFHESVRKNARDCFKRKGFAGNRCFQGTANFGYLDAILRLGVDNLDKF